MTPFDFIAQLTATKEYAFTGNEAEQTLLSKEYTAYMINRGMSLYPDTVFFAAEMSRYHELPNKMQYDFYFYGIPKKKRYAAWPKKQKPEDIIAILQEKYQVGRKKAEEYANVLSDSQLAEIKEIMSQGGMKKR